MHKTLADLTDESFIDMRYITIDSGFSDRYFYKLRVPATNQIWTMLKMALKGLL